MAVTQSVLIMVRKFDCMRGILNGYDFIQSLCDRKAKNMLILDTECPTKWEQKWKPTGGNVEIITRGGHRKDASGKNEDSDGEFTKALVYNLGYLLKEINGDRKGWKAPMTIPELLSVDKTMDFNPVRIQLNTTKRRAGKDTEEIKIDPKRMRTSGKIEFFSYLKPGLNSKHEEAADEDKDGEEEEDENEDGDTTRAITDSGDGGDDSHDNTAASASKDDEDHFNDEGVHMSE
jgi:hypothetical protein